MKKRVLCLLLAVIMVFGLLPATALADGDADASGKIEISFDDCTEIGTYDDETAYYYDASQVENATGVVFTDLADSMSEDGMIAAMNSNTMVLATNEATLAGFAITKAEIDADEDWDFAESFDLSAITGNLYAYWIMDDEYEMYYVLVQADAGEVELTAPTFTATVDGQEVDADAITFVENGYTYTGMEYAPTDPAADSYGYIYPECHADLYVVPVGANTDKVSFEFSDACLAYGYDDDNNTSTEGLDEYEGGFVGKTTAVRSVDKDGDGNMDSVRVQSPYDAAYNSTTFYGVTFVRPEAEDKTEDVTIYAYPSFLKTVEMYSYDNGEVGTADYLDGVTRDSSNNFYTSAPAGDYLLKGTYSNDDPMGTLVITVEEDGTNKFELCACSSIKLTNSGWVLGTDYTIDVSISDQARNPRTYTLGEVSGCPACFCLKGDTIEVTFTPTEARSSFMPLYKSQTLTSNTSISGSCVEAIPVTFTVPAGSTLDMGTLKSYYVYTFEDMPQPTTNEDGTLTYSVKVPKATDYFYRVQNPNGVTYWNYNRWSAAAEVTVTADDLYIGSNTVTKNTVNRTYSENLYDRADIYLNINEAGYKNMAVGETFELNSFRNWFAIESISNAKVALPDMHYQVINPDGTPSDVVSITPDAKNSNVANMTANKAGTAIVLITYDAMTHNNALTGLKDSANKAIVGSTFSAIWPECTGVFVVTVGADGTGIKSNMVIDRLNDTSGVLDAEHDILFYAGNEGASYTFTPEAGTTVSVDRSVVTDKMTFGGFTTEGVSVDQETGAVTVSGLTTGRHIIKVEKNGMANYQVITTRGVSYEMKDAQGNALTADSVIKAGDTVQVQFSNLVNPKEKISGAYNFNASLYYKGEEGTFFQSNPGGSFGVYDFSSVPARQLISITIPKYWAESTYTLDGVIKMGGFAGVPTHRGITYAKGTNPGFNAPNVSMILGALPQLTIDLAETDFISAKLNFQDETGKAIDRKDLTITMKDAAGNGIVVGEDGSFKAVAETFSYTINANGYEYTVGSIDVTEENTEFTVTLQSAAVGAWDGMTYTEPEKAEDGFYLVKTGAELAWLSKQVADKAFNTFNARLVNDIDLANYPWTAVNTSSYSYAYKLDGAGHEIKKLNTTKGLFGTVATGSEIYDLTVSGVITNTSGSAGGIVGYLQGGTVRNCVSNVSITDTGASKSNFGGIAGYIGNATITRCVNNGAINVEGKQVGGIVGSTINANAVVSDCYNTAAVTGGSEVGGVIGYDNYKITVTNCYNLGAVSGTTNVGGFAGKLVGTKVTACYSTGAVTGGKGFVGSSTATLTKCYAIADDDYAEVLSSAAMKSAELGEGYKLACNRYPALAWQTDVTAHTPAEETVVTAPTCTERGYTTYTCTNCTESYMGDYVDALGHTPGEDLTVYPTHKTYTCAVCEESITEWNDARLQHMTMPESDATVNMSDTGDYPWTYDTANDYLRSSNKGSDNTSSTTAMTFTLDCGGTLKFDYAVSSEARYDKLTITLGDETIADAISGEETGSVDKALPAGTYTLTMTFTKDSSSAGGKDMAWVTGLTITAISKEEAESIANHAAADPVIEAIEAIGEVTLEKEEAIKAARAAYKALTDAQKALVTNEKTLTNAEAKLANLKKPTPTPGDDDTITVTFRLIGSTKPTADVDLSKGEEGYNGAKYVTWVKTTSYTLDEGDTVGTLFVKAMDAAGLSYEGLENNYISSITAPSVCGGYTLAEMDNGPNSGWMYTVNGEHPNRGLNDWALFNGDEVIWHYVDDWAYEVSDWTSDPDYPTLGDGTLYDKWLEAADVKPTAPVGGSAADSDQAAADKVIAAIDAIGTVTADSGEKIKAVREAYDDLTDAQKKLVTNYDTLTAAEKALAELNGKTKKFVDVPEDTYYTDAVAWAVEKDITAGIGNNKFGTGSGCTREQMVTFLWNLAGKPEAKGESFADVASGSYYETAIAWAKNLGITSGKTDGTFGVGDTVTREQVVTFLWNYAGQPEPQASASFDDVAADAYFAKAVAWAKEEGITSGIGGGKFGVGQVCAREQIVTLMYNYFAEK